MADLRSLRCHMRRAGVFFALAVCVLAGCRSNSQGELIERELRWQENQIYTLEDYLMEYQAKVRRLREENAALAESLAECEQNAGSGTAVSARSRSSSRAVSGPDVDGRRTSPATEPEEMPTPPTDSVPEQLDDPPLKIPEIPLPDVPPLDEPSPTTWIGPRREWISPPPIEHLEREVPWISGNSAAPAGFVRLQPSAPPVASHLAARDAAAKSQGEEGVAGGTEPVRRLPTALPADFAPPPARNWIAGGLPDEPDSEAADRIDVAGIPPLDSIDFQADDEPAEFIPPSEFQPAGQLVVVEGDETIGPAVSRLILEADLSARDAGEQLQVTVTPLSAEGEPTFFHGTASLMLRDPAVEGPEGRLARWDYDARQIAEHWETSARGEVMRFTLPLDEPLAPDKPVALWVRLQSDAGEDGSTRKVLDHLTLRLEPPAKARPVELSNGEWAVALPGKPALLDNKESEVTSAWRSSSARVR